MMRAMLRVANQSDKERMEGESIGKYGRSVERQSDHG